MAGPLNGWRGKQQCPCACHPDFSWLSVPTNVRFHLTDVDALFFAERGDRVLFVECKHAGEAERLQGKLLTGYRDGQFRALQSLAKRSGVLVLWLEFQGDVPQTLLRVGPSGFGPPQPTSQVDFQLRFHAWYDGRSLDINPEPLPVRRTG